MNLPERSIFVDIGGGQGELVSRLAYKNPKTDFYIVDPLASRSTTVLCNVHIFPQRVDLNLPLPLTTACADNVSINYLMGEVQSSQVNEQTLDDTLARYAILVMETSRVLAPKGKVLVMDVRGNIEFAKNLFGEYGFKTCEPAVVEDRGVTVYTRLFFQIFDQSARKLEESEILPMQFTAWK